MKHKVNDSIPAMLLVVNAATITTLLPILLHQLGVLDHLPDPPSKIFDSDRITESKAAHPLGIPDGLLGLGSFGMTLGLAVVARSNPHVRKYLALKLAGDTAVAGVNVVRQVISFRKLCSWCTGTALGAFAATAIGFPLIRREWRASQLPSRSPTHSNG